MNKKIIYILLAVSFVLFLILALVFNGKSSHAIENSRNSLNKFSRENNYKDSYIYIDYLSENNKGYIIAFDDSEPSVVYLSDKLLDEIKEYNYDNRNIKLVGDSLEITDEIKNNILTIYNQDSIEEEEDYLKKEDFSSVFGSFYLNVDRIEDDNTLYKRPSFLSSLFLDISLVSLLVLGFKIILDRRK